MLTPSRVYCKHNKQFYNKKDKKQTENKLNKIKFLLTN